MSAEAGPSGRTAPWWRQGLTVLGLLSLFVTLAFNAIGVWEGSRSEKQARATEEIRLLTDLDSKATAAEQSVNELGLASASKDELSFHEDAAFLAAVNYYEYLAWLYNEGRLKETRSREAFRGRLSRGWELIDDYGDQENYPQLGCFLKKTACP